MKLFSNVTEVVINTNERVRKSVSKTVSKRFHKMRNKKSIVKNSADGCDESNHMTCSATVFAEGSLSTLSGGSSSPLMDTTNSMTTTNSILCLSTKSEEIRKAVFYGDLQIVEKLLDEGVDVDTRDCDNSTILCYAALLGHAYIVQLLLYRGANVNLADDDGYTPYHEASRDGHTDIMKMLVDYGADPNTTSTDEVFNS